MIFFVDSYFLPEGSNKSNFHRADISAFLPGDQVPSYIFRFDDHFGDIAREGRNGPQDWFNTGCHVSKAVVHAQTSRLSL